LFHKYIQNIDIKGHLNAVLVLWIIINYVSIWIVRFLEIYILECISSQNGKYKEILMNVLFKIFYIIQVYQICFKERFELLLFEKTFRFEIFPYL
jgi:hypothetical protein